MKKGALILSIFFALTVIWNSLQVTITYAYYSLDSDGFIEWLCENKEKPELQCNGKCYLMQIIQKKGNDKQSQTPLPKTEIKNIVLFFEEGKDSNIENHLDSKILPLTYYSNLYSYTTTFSHYHPPQYI